MTFAERCGAQTPARAAACERLRQRLAQDRTRLLRVAWADLHGVPRVKTLVLDGEAGQAALDEALDDGVGMVGTLLLKDRSDRTAVPVFDAALPASLRGFAGAGNLVLLPDPESHVSLPWAEATAWLRGEPFGTDARPLEADPRRALQRALAALRDEHGLTLRCGLEVEFHVWRIAGGDDAASPADATWPPEPPAALALVHGGHHLLGEAETDRAHAVLAVVRDTALGLGLPLRSLEIELGPSQFEAVFAPCDALAAADRFVLFRSGVTQALRRAGYFASFACRPPFEHAVASGWHLHQSLCEAGDGRGAMAPARAAAAAVGLRPGAEAGDGAEADAGTGARAGQRSAAVAVAVAVASVDTSDTSDTGHTDALHHLSPRSAQWLAGLLAHAGALAALCAPSLPAYARYGGSPMAPRAAVWGIDQRGAMLRVVGAGPGGGDDAVRIENRLGEPQANPYLAIAAQVWAGLDGLRRGLPAPPSTDRPYGGGPALPSTLAQALDALDADAVLRDGLGEPLCALLQAVQRQTLERHAAADDRDAWMRREYFGRG